MPNHPATVSPPHPSLRCLRIVRHVLLIAVLTFACGELYVRHLGYHPITPELADQIQGSDYLLSYTCGHLPLPGYKEPEEGAPSGEWVWPNNQRASRPLPVIKRPLYKVALLGCSWTYGQGAEDGATFAWRLNEQYPRIEFDNYGVIDYGAYQTRLRLHDILASQEHYDLFIYSCIYDHLFRDCPDIWYLLNNDVGIFYMPGYEINNPHKTCRLQKSQWWGETYFALPRFFHIARTAYIIEQNTLVRFQPSDMTERQEAWRENVLAMRDMCQTAGSRFAVLGLGRGADEVLRRGLAGTNIMSGTALGSENDAICFNPIPSDGSHPNARGHAKIAAAVSAVLQRQHLPAEVTATWQTSRHPHGPPPHIPSYSRK